MTQQNAPNLIRNWDYFSYPGYQSAGQDATAGVSGMTFTNIQTGNLSGGRGKRLAFVASSTNSLIYTPVLPLCRPGTDVFTGFRARVRAHSTNWAFSAASAPVPYLRTYNAVATTISGRNDIANFAYITGGTLGTQMRDGSNAQTNSSTGNNQALAAGWHMFEFLVDAAGTTSAFIDGALVQSSTATSTAWLPSSGSFVAQAVSLAVLQMSVTYEAAVADLYYAFL